MTPIQNCTVSSSTTASYHVFVFKASKNSLEISELKTRFKLITEILSKFKIDSKRKFLTRNGASSSTNSIAYYAVASNMANLVSSFFHHGE